MRTALRSSGRIRGAQQQHMVHMQWMGIMGRKVEGGGGGVNGGGVPVRAEGALSQPGGTLSARAPRGGLRWEFRPAGLFSKGLTMTAPRAEAGRDSDTGSVPSPSSLPGTGCKPACRYHH